MTLMGLCSEVRTVRASELLDYTNYEGDYEFEMGIGRPPEHRPLLETPDILVFAWGATVPMIAHAAGIEARRDHHHLGQVGDARPSARRPRASSRRATSPPCGSPSTASTRARPASSSSTSTASATTPRRTGRRATENDVYRVDIEGTPSIFQETAFRFTDGSGRDAAAAGCLATGLRALNAVPAVNDLPPGWVTPLDLPLIAGRTIR